MQVLRVVVVTEGKMPSGVQPTDVLVMTVFRFDNANHGKLLLSVKPIFVTTTIYTKELRFWFARRFQQVNERLELLLAEMAELPQVQVHHRFIELLEQLQSVRRNG